MNYIEKKYTTLFLLVFLAITLSSCKSDQEPLLINTWVSSYEEGMGIYRPMDFKDYPASHFRQSYNFKSNNECEYLVLSPVDAHYIESGTYEYKESDKTIKIYAPQGQLYKELKVEKLTANLLRLE